MKIVKQDKRLNLVSVIAQSPDDLYTLYNIITPTDRISAKTTRRIKGEAGESKSKSRLQVNIKLKVEETEFHGFGDIIRIRGKIVEASDSQVTIGTYHTIKVELFKPLTIEKSTPWNIFDLQKIKEAQLGTPTGLFIVSIDDESAIISQVGSHATKIILELRPTIPRKGSDPKQHRTATLDFFKTLLKFLIEIKQDKQLDYLLIGGPGFTKDNFREFLKDNQFSIKQLKIIDTQSAGRSGINEIITYHIPEKLIAGNIASLQARLIEKVLETIGKDTGLIAYGRDAYNAAKMGAIEYLLVLDNEIHGDVAHREKILKLMNLVNKNRGKTVLMSSMHESGNILKGLGNIVAILRFKIRK